MLGTFLFAHSLHAGLLRGQSDRTGGLLTERSFSMMHDFRQSSEAVGLPQVSKMLQQLTGQISAHYSTSKIRNIHLRLFRPDQGPYTVFPFSEQKGPITIPFGVARRPMGLIQGVPPPPGNQRSRTKVLFNGSKVKNLATLNNDPRKVQYNLTVLNSQKERADKFALPTWQMNLVVVTIIGKEISAYSKNPIS